MIESLNTVVSAGPGGGVDESARRVAAKSPVECRRGGAKGGVAKSHGALVRRVLSSASAIVLLAASAPGSVGRGWPCTREGSKGPFQR